MGQEEVKVEKHHFEISYSRLLDRTELVFSSIGGAMLGIADSHQGRGQSIAREYYRKRYASLHATSIILLTTTFAVNVRVRCPTELSL
ncbi:hypothetical protein BDV98DRAFT_14682 [Pterulicium gracile]|uniref:Uncharacterized protein n=1 Tax=Pterulicium gracile TaxID=1884261 RepID=A0A5C3R2S7_9AGAR|nr:hypothetical protein BDV98DRAFT_14682 [Pterula gracilis]